MSSLITSSAIGAPSRELIRCPRLESPQWACYPCRPDAAAEKPGSQPHAGGTCAVLKALKFMLELLKTKTEKMTGRI